MKRQPSSMGRPRPDHDRGGCEFDEHGHCPCGRWQKGKGRRLGPGINHRTGPMNLDIIEGNPSGDRA